MSQSAINKTNNSYEVLIFDLDDTLLDTVSLLIPHAIEESCEAMILAGLNSDQKSCIKKQTEYLLVENKETPFRATTEFFGTSSDDEQTIAAGREAYYHREVTEDLSPFSGVYKLLEQLKQNYQLFLVTAGHSETQKQKIDKLDIEKYFKKVFFVGNNNNSTKQQAFSEILNLTSVHKEQCLSIGNRLDDEIRAAHLLGMDSCLVHQGESASIEEAIQPTFEIQSIGELIKTCHL